MQRLIAIGDIHGSYRELVQLIENVIKYNPQEDKLIFLGDYIDRGKDSKYVLDYLCKLREESPESIVLLLGNHEDMALNAVMEGYSSHEHQLWVRNGGEMTIKSFRAGCRRDEADNMNNFIYNFVPTLKPYHEENGFIFVHAGLPTNTAPENASLEDMLWMRDYECYDRSPAAYLGKRLVIGHTPTGSGGAAGVFVGDAVINVDTHCYHSGILSAYDVLNGIEYNSREAEPYER